MGRRVSGSAMLAATQRRESASPGPESAPPSPPPPSVRPSVHSSIRPFAHSPAVRSRGAVDCDGDHGGH